MCQFLHLNKGSLNFDKQLARLTNVNSPKTRLTNVNSPKTKYIYYASVSYLSNFVFVHLSSTFFVYKNAICCFKPEQFCRRPFIYSSYLNLSYFISASLSQHKFIHFFISKSCYNFLFIELLSLDSEVWGVINFLAMLEINS